MYDIFATDGIVLGKRGVGEANTLVSVLTREFGLVRPTARSTRVERSKLRYGLEPLTRARFSLVKGKREWKLVGVEHINRDFMTPALSHRARAALGRVSKLLLRLITGEEPTP